MDPKLLIFFDNEINAQDIKERLDEAGIGCVLQNELKTSVNVMSESAAEVVAVYVDKKDYSVAKNILDTYEKENEDKGIWCPECESEDITIKVEHLKYKPTWLLVVCILVFLLCVILPFFIKGYIFIPGIIFIVSFIMLIKGYDKKTYHCNKCGKVFSEKDRF